MATDQDYYLDLYKITIEVYGKNFKSGSTSTTVNAGWAGNKYTVARKSDSTIIASTSVSLSSDQITTTTPSSELILAEVSASDSDSKYLPIKMESNESDINKKLSISKYIKINKVASSTPNVSDVKVNNPSGTWTLYPGNTFDSSGNLAPLQITINDSPKTLKLLSGNKIEVKYPTLSMSATKNTTYTENTFLNIITPSNSDQIFFVKTYEADDNGKEAKSSGYIKVEKINEGISNIDFVVRGLPFRNSNNEKNITAKYSIQDDNNTGENKNITCKAVDFILKMLYMLQEQYGSTLEIEHISVSNVNHTGTSVFIEYKENKYASFIFPVNLITANDLDYTWEWSSQNQ